MLYKLTYPIYRLLKNYPIVIPIGLLVLFVGAFGSLIYAKIYQHWDQDDQRGAIAFENGAFGESYSIPRYLDQGWTKNDSLWFYNTSQGSGLMPYDLFMALQGKDDKPFKSDENFDRFRYLPQKKTFFNPDALPVGFTKTTYKGRDYIGYTCAACHTGQINFTEKGSKTTKAIRIDGGPAMADMVGFLTDLQAALESTLDPKNEAKRNAFVAAVKKLNNNYRDDKEVLADLKKWTDSVQRYNLVNKSKVAYGHARLDAFGRIYNRVAQYAISADQLKKLLKLAVTKGKNGEDKFLLTSVEVDKVMEDIGERIVLSDEEFSLVIERLMMPKAAGYPGLTKDEFVAIKDMIFNPPDAPVSYPFLWDISHSDFLQWNGLAPNAGPGPLGRNTGEVIGVFGILDWGVISWWKHPFTMLWQSMSLSSFVSGQKNKKHIIGFDSSINTFNLYRLESRLRDLKSPEWPFCKTAPDEYYIPDPTKELYLVPSDPAYCQGKGVRFDEDMKRRGELIYIDRCRGCHTVVDRSAWDRVVVGHMSDAKRLGTDGQMAHNAVHRTGKSGNFTDTYQKTAVGDLIVAEDAPVVQILTAATAGVIATPDADKWWPRRMVEWIYALVMSFADNPIKKSVKNGDYNPDTTAEPYASLGAYKGRSLNGIWATAPYLHNGSVPTLRELLKRPRDRTPSSFDVGGREFDPTNVGFKTDRGVAFGKFTDVGNSNGGHDYFCKKKPKTDSQPEAIGVQRAGAVEPSAEVECMTEKQIDDLMEYLKSL